MKDQQYIRQRYLKPLKFAKITLKTMTNSIYNMYTIFQWLEYAHYAAKKLQNHNM